MLNGFPTQSPAVPSLNWLFQWRRFVATVAVLLPSVNISSAIFDCSAPDLDSCPDESLPEFAFIGRSNVGKSSLLNMLVGKPALARVSTTPGFTRLINFFTVNRRWRLVDLPGYGYARVARKERSQFNRAVGVYLRDRSNLCCVFALIDSSLPPQAIDLEFVEWLAGNSVPFVLVFTKTDTVASALVDTNIAAFKERIAEWFEELPEVFTCSAVTRHGRQDLLGVIEAAVAAVPPGPAAASQETAVTPPPAVARASDRNSPGRSHGQGSKATRPW